MSVVEEIIEKYLDDRDQLSEAEIATLVDALRRSPPLAADLKEQLVLNELLGQRFGVDRQNFIAQVEQRIRDYKLDEEELEEQVRELQSLAENEFEQWNRRTRRARTIRLWVTVAALLLIAVGIGSWFSFTPSWWKIAVVEIVQGGVTRPGTGGPEAVHEGDQVIAGDVYQTSKDQLVTFRYQDGTTVQIGGNSSIQFAVDRVSNGKIVKVHHGNISAKVRSQTSGVAMVFKTPIAEAEVVGTELFLTVQPTWTRLDVLDGSVKLTRTVDGGYLSVQRGHYGVATTADLTFHRCLWPLSRDRLVFLFQTADQPNLVFDPATKLHMRCVVRPRGMAGVNADQAMVLTQGAFEAIGFDENLLEACRKSNQLSVEAVLRPHYLEQDEPGRIITFSSHALSRNFALSQQEARIIFQVRTSDFDADELQPEIEICELPDDGPHHVAVTFKPGRLVGYLDGRKCCDHELLSGDFREWTLQQLVFGDEHDGGRDWSGTLEGVAIYSRFLTADEVQQSARTYRKLIDARFQRAGQNALDQRAFNEQANAD